MSKTKISYVCQSCGATSVKWQGKCPSCGEWNSIVEEIVSVKKTEHLAPRSLHSKTFDTLADFGATKPKEFRWPIWKSTV